MQHANDNHQPNTAGQPVTFFSVCSGIEAASVAWHPLGWRCVGVSEIDTAASKVLAHHYPDVPNHGDFTQVDTKTLPRIDVLVGGTPCQAFSVAGARQSLADARGNLTLSYVVLAHGLVRDNGLRNAVWENVPGVLNTKDNAFGCFLGALVGADAPIPPPDGKRWPNQGMVSGPLGRAAWRVLDAQFFGVPQRRRRVFVVADFGDGADPAAVLFERVGLQGNTPPSRETRKDVAPTISARPTGGGGLGTDFDLDGGLIEYAIQAGALRENPDSGPDGVGVQARIAYTLEARAEVQAVAYDPDLARCDATREGSSQDYETTTMVVSPFDQFNASLGEHVSQTMEKGDGHARVPSVLCITGAVTRTLKAEGSDASEDGTGRGTQIIAFDCKGTQVQYTTDGTISTLRSMGHADSHQNAGGHAAVAFTVALRGREGGATAELCGDIATALRASTGGEDKPHVLTSAVRRLTPRECERLQGFPDDYTRIPIRVYAKPKYTALRPADMWSQIDGQWWLMATDGPRYKQLGNSMAVPVMHWIGSRIDRLMPSRAANDNTSKKAAA